jgi:spore coat protein U-like protein
MFKKTLLATAMVVTGGFVMTAPAATTAQFDVRITITPACSVVAGAGSDIDFGNVPADTAAGDALLKDSNTISVTCSKTTPYIVGLATGDGNNGTGQMSGTGANLDKVPYSLFQDAGYSVVWGNTGTAVGSAGNDYAGTGTGSTQAIPVYAEVTNANWTPDTYTDTVTVNVLF